MASDKQAPHPSGRVVYVRLEEDLIQRLDSLADRTGRSKGFYLRLALRAVLPTLEEYHWNQIAAQFEDGVIDRQLREIMTQTLNDQEESKDGKSLSFLSGHIGLWTHSYMSIRENYFASS